MFVFLGVGFGWYFREVDLVEYYCFVVVYQYVVFQVIVQFVCEYQFFYIFVQLYYVFDVVVVSDLYYVLFDDWIGIQFFGYVMVGCVDQFDFVF